MAQTKAWLMELDAEYLSAIGNQNMVEYIISADIEIMPVPLAPDYSPGVMLWRNQIIPVIDLVLVLNPLAQLADEMSGVMVLAYQEAPGAPLQHGAIVLRGAPQNILVDADMACPLPESPAAWRKLAVACIASSDKAVPILNVKSLFSSSLRQLYKESQQGESAAVTEAALMQEFEATVNKTKTETEETSEVTVPAPVFEQAKIQDDDLAEPAASFEADKSVQEFEASVDKIDTEETPQVTVQPPVSDSFADTDAGFDAASTITDTQPDASMIDDAPSVLPAADHGMPNEQELTDNTIADETCFDETQGNTNAQEVPASNNDMANNMTAEKVAEHEASTLNPPAAQPDQSKATTPPMPEADVTSEAHDFNGETHKDVDLIPQHESPVQSRPPGGGYRNKYGPGSGHQTPRTGAWRPGRWAKNGIKPKSDN